MKNDPPKDSHRAATISGPPHIFGYIRQEARREGRTFSGEMMRLIREGFAVKYGKEILERLDGRGPGKH